MGLVKAQQVKNAVIVPTGAKGGFICKRQSALTDRDEILAEGIECYKTLIRGLLDVTDNIINGEIVSPTNVICKDETDPYLVVAADKGTATFSDIANSVSAEYGHWLGDAFASGGSQGYDHKKMGITARGGWVSVQRHFRELGRDVQKEPFTVLGIGDMGGDVFGNGLLLSDQAQLVAAFNHAHIFIDPTPDTAKSFLERKRLFEMPRCTWSDYNRECISEGGGVYSRMAKSIAISPQMKVAFNISDSALTPNDLIKKLLQSPVDLIWNGGIGTYVKGSAQTHADVGDKANDALRVNGAELKCKVFGEGGNLGMTQLGRVEFALHGGACNTDFIDNAGGVDCSDHEVNIKILLQGITQAGDLTLKQRNILLGEMTDAVAELVLNNNYRQTMALSLAEAQSKSRTSEIKRFIRDLEQRGRLDRVLEYLPENHEINEREKQGLTFTRPELAIVLSYAKVELKEAFIAADLTTEPSLVAYVNTAFPEIIVQRFPEPLSRHPLLKEIVATQVANDVVHILGITAAHRLASSTGSTLKAVAVAFVMAKKIFKMDEFIEYMRSLDNIISTQVQYDLLANMARRVRRGTRWFLKNRRGDFDPDKEAGIFTMGIEKVNPMVELALSKNVKDKWHERMTLLGQNEIAAQWLQQLAVPDFLFSGLSAVEVANQLHISAEKTGLGLFALYEAFGLDWLAQKLSFMPVANAWQAKARETYLDELDNQLRNMVRILFTSAEVNSVEDVATWLNLQESAIARWSSLLTDVQQEESWDFAVFSVLIGELIDCVNNRLG